MTKLELVLAALERCGCDPRPTGEGWMAKCPAHDDRNPSLHVTRGDSHPVVLHCFAGCEPHEVLQQLGLRWEDVMEPRYRNTSGRDRTNETGARTRAATAPAPARTRRENVRDTAATSEWSIDRWASELNVSVRSLQTLRARPVPHGWLAVPMCDARGTRIGVQFRHRDGRKRNARRSRLGLFVPQPRPGRDARLYIAEGMSDTAALLCLGLPAIGQPSATAGDNYVLQYVQDERPTEVVVVADKDEAGRRRARRLASKLAAIVRTRIIEPPQHKDVREWLSAGAQRQDIEALVARA